MFLLAAFLPLSLVAQVSLPQPLEGDTGIYLQCLPTGEKILNWSGRADRTYFLQTSPDLLDWSWSPNIELGRNGPMNQAVEGPVRAGFFRLIYTDQVPAEGETVETADYDGDGLSNRLELTPRPRPGGVQGVQGVIGLKPDIQTNPLRADTDGDGLSDQWELENGLDPTDDGSRNPNNGSNGDPDGDGFSNLVEQNQRTNPENAEDFPIQMISTWKMATGTGDTTPAEQTDFYLTSYAGWDAQTGSTQVVSQVTYASIQAARDGMIFPTTPGSNLQNYQISNGLTSAGATSYFTLSPQSDNVNGYFSSTRIWIKAPAKSTEQKFYFLKIEEQGIGASEAESSQTEGITITIPANQQFSAPYDLEVNPLQQAGVQRWSSVVLLPMDLDIVHPVTDELADAKEDIDDGGYVSVQRLEDPADLTSDATPRTKLKIHAIPGAQSTWKIRLKFSGADRYKVYRDEARTQEVVSEQTEFDANQDTTLFFHGFKKSASRGGEMVMMQVKVNDAWLDGDSVKCTIVQSEFLIQVKAFIPYAWTEAEEEVPGPNGLSPMTGKVAKGDLHPFTLPRSNGRPVSPGFRNRYSTDREPSGALGEPTFDLFDNAPFRVCQKIILTPYKDLHSSYDLISGRKVWTAPSSDHYVKATSVNPAEISFKKGFMSLSGGTSATGKPPITIEDYRQGARTGRVTELHIESAGKDGAMGWLITLTDDIHWDMWMKINSEANPLFPTVEFGGKHDSYPAYEIIVIQSDGTYKPIHNVSPAAGAYPGPSSLDDGNAINIGRSDTITQ